MKTFTSFYFFLAAVMTATGQIKLTFDKKNVEIAVRSFTIHQVSNKTGNANLSIGEIFVSKTKKEKLSFETSLEMGLYHYFKLYNPKEPNLPKIGLEIEKLSVTEEINAQGLIDGHVYFTVSAYDISREPYKKICTNRNQGRYTRSFQSAFIDQVKGQIQVNLDGGLKFINQFIETNKGKLEAFTTRSSVIIKPFKTNFGPDTVYYQKRKVNWQDFQGEIRQQSQYGAAIFSSFSFESKMFVENGILKVEITPAVFTDKYMSWAKPSTKNDYSLKHEQLHFDICYLMALRFLTTIKNFKANTLDDLNSLIQYEYLEYYKKTHRLQEQYDTETNHSLIVEKQHLWQEKINTEIKLMPLSEIFN